MTETFRCEDKDALVGYLYDELTEEAREQLDRHLRHCDACASEVSALQAVRRDLAGWDPPEADLGFQLVSHGARPARTVWHEVPAWARVAAAVFLLGVGLAVANVQVRYDEGGWLVSTGWMTPPAAAVSLQAPVESAQAADVPEEAWRAELAMLERRLRDEMAARPVTVATERPSAPPVDPDALLRRVTALIEDSELRQRQELAFRLTQFNRDLEMQRRADLVRIERGIGQVEGRTGAEVARQREALNYLVRVSQRPQD
jgi:anti-sigma factor RsiW